MNLAVRTCAVHPDCVALADKVRFLSAPEAYPGRPAVTVRETHMSWIFFAGERVYKLKKPARLPYLDFSTLALRERACREEVRINRRLAPDVYLGVAALLVEDEALRVGEPDGSDAAVADWLVVMRRLQTGRSLDVRLAQGVRPAELDRLAGTLARFYRCARRVHPGSAHRRQAELGRDLDRRALLDLRLLAPRGLVRSVAAAQAGCARALERPLDERLRRGWVVDGHGDLRPEHIWLDGEVRIIDGLEFDPRLRQVDPLEEIAFLDLECERLGHPAIGRRLRRATLWRLGGRDGDPLYAFYRSVKAVQRARLAAAHLLEPHPRTPEVWPLRTRQYLRLAAADLRRVQAWLRRRGGG